jgi:hypothetical protein
MKVLAVPFPAAGAALDKLRQAGIVQTRLVERGATAYLAREVLELINAHRARWRARSVNGQRDFPVGGQLISLLADS